MECVLHIIYILIYQASSSMQAHNVKGDKEKIVQLENTVVKQTVEYAKEVEKIKKEMTVRLNCNVCKNVCCVYVHVCVYI